MARRTQIIFECDRCKKTLETKKDGLVVRGFVSAPNAPNDALIGHNPNTWEKQPDEVALCWACIRKVAPDPELEVLRAQTQEAVRSSSSLREYLDDPPSYSAGRGPSGPLPPPELPHCVRTAQALCGVVR